MPHCVTVALDLCNLQVAWWNGDTRSQQLRYHPVSPAKSSLLMPALQKRGFWQRPSNNHPILPSFHHSIFTPVPTVAKADTHPGFLSAVLAVMTNVCQGHIVKDLERDKGEERV